MNQMLKTITVSCGLFLAVSPSFPVTPSVEEVDDLVHHGLGYHDNWGEAITAIMESHKLTTNQVVHALIKVIEAGREDNSRARYSSQRDFAGRALQALGEFGDETSLQYLRSCIFDGRRGPFDASHKGTMMRSYIKACPKLDDVFSLVDDVCGSTNDLLVALHYDAVSALGWRASRTQWEKDAPQVVSNLFSRQDHDPVAVRAADEALCRLRPAYATSHQRQARIASMLATDMSVHCTDYFRHQGQVLARLRPDERANFVLSTNTVSRFGDSTRGVGANRTADASEESVR